MSIFTITGGAGFIGSHLADALLAAGHQVRILDDFSTGKAANVDPRCQVLRGDVGDPHLVQRALLDCAGCFHLAAIASVARANEDWLGTHKVNLGGTVTVLEAARALGRLPVVYASSAAVYGNVADIADEDRRPAPLTAYGADKYGSELHALAGWTAHRLPTLGFRFFNVYGPRQDPNSPYSGVISIFGKAIAADQPVVVHGDGRQTRDLIYVSDIVAYLMDGMDHLGRNPGGHVVNACTGQESSVLEMARRIAETLGRASRISHGPARAGDIRRSVGCSAKADALLGARPKRGLQAGLVDTLAGLAVPLPQLGAAVAVN